MTLYKGSQKIKDTNSYGVYKGSTPIGAIFKGSEKVYMFHKATTWQAGTTLQAYQVSKYCNKIRVDCVGSAGYNANTPGKGGRVQCDMDVTGGQILYITVGARPTSRNIASYNASDIRTNNTGVTDTTSLNSRLIVAGGGGSYGNQSGSGGNGGGLTGQNGQGGDGKSGGGGTSTAGGRGGSAGTWGNSGAAGKLGLGGNGSSGSSGAGGAGYYGGGGGGNSAYADVWGGNGGGGSSYTSSACSNVTHTQGYRNGAGYITITEIG
jgi:hypothetical protein